MGGVVDQDGFGLEVGDFSAGKSKAAKGLFMRGRFWVALKRIVNTAFWVN
jgi:hypothetical protein